MQEKLKNNIACETANYILKELMIQQMKEKKQRRYSNELFKVSFLFSLNTIIYENSPITIKAADQQSFQRDY